MKKITQDQIQGILGLLEKYNVGVKDFVAAQQLFEKLPLVDEIKTEERKIAEDIDNKFKEDNK